MVDQDYTTADHSFREHDDYARAKYDITLRWLGPADGRRLLNIGCGNGLFNELAHQAGFVVEACEPDPVAYALAAASSPTGIVVHPAGLFDAPFSGPADVLVMHDVLEHVGEEAEAVDRIAELLHDGGRAIVSVPALQSLFGHHDELLGHHRRYSRRTLSTALSTRMHVRRMRYFGFAFIPVTAWYSRWRRQPYPTATAAGPTLVGRAFSLACRTEGRVPMPLGTSLICEAIRPPTPPSTAAEAFR